MKKLITMIIIADWLQ